MDAIRQITSPNIREVDMPLYMIHSNRFKYNVQCLRTQPYPLLRPKIITFTQATLTKTVDEDMMIWGIAKLASATEQINIFADDEPLFDSKFKVNDFPLSTLPAYQLPVPWVLRQNQLIMIEPASNGSFSLALYGYYTKIDKDPRRFPYLYAFEFSSHTANVMQTIIKQTRNDMNYVLTNISQNDISSFATTRSANLLIDSYQILNGDPYAVVPNPQFARRWFYQAGKGATLQMESLITSGSQAAYDILVGGYYEFPAKD